MLTAINFEVGTRAAVWVGHSQSDEVVCDFSISVSPMNYEKGLEGDNYQITIKNSSGRIVKNVRNINRRNLAYKLSQEDIFSVTANIGCGDSSVSDCFYDDGAKQAYVALISYVATDRQADYNYLAQRTQLISNCMEGIKSGKYTELFVTSRTFQCKSSHRVD